MITAKLVGVAAFAFAAVLMLADANAVSASSCARPGGWPLVTALAAAIFAAGGVYALSTRNKLVLAALTCVVSGILAVIIVVWVHLSHCAE